MKRITLTVFIILFSIIAFAQEVEYLTMSDVPYYVGPIMEHDNYIKERCVLDIYYPKNINNFSTIVWFHGGGLTGGEKEIPRRS